MNEILPLHKPCHNWNTRDDAALQFHQTCKNILVSWPGQDPPSSSASQPGMRSFVRWVDSILDFICTQTTSVSWRTSPPSPVTSSLHTVIPGYIACCHHRHPPPKLDSMPSTSLPRDDTVESGSVWHAHATFPSTAANSFSNWTSSFFGVGFYGMGYSTYALRIPENPYAWVFFFLL